ncbi:wax ester/triacylglycerol synthase domain-containing protein [Streptomyces sp. NPDC000134]|uniref:wax ester/triacylglycerol synthase domain-containing protein n=1 Tax=Streptomyces sp. NPDC000134 TaxID=3364536 RepID=UPI003679FF13
MTDAETPYPAVDQVIGEMEGGAHYLHIGAALEMDGAAPARQEVREHLRARLPLLPPLSGCEDHLDDHVRELTVPTGTASNWSAAYDALVNQPAPCARRPWGVWLVTGAGTDGYLLCYRGHHALHDGTGVLRLVRLLFSRPEPVAAAMPARAPARPPAAARAGGYARNLGASARLLLPAPRRPLLPAAPAGRRVVSRAVVPVAALRAAARALDCSVLDVYLGALSAAAEAADPTGWTAERWRARGIGVPVSLERAGPTPYRGNRFAVALLDIPWREKDLAERVRIISRRTAPLRDPGVRWALGHALGRLSVAGTRGFSARLFARCGAQTTLLSSAADLGFAGRRARRFTGLNCLPADFPYQPVLTLWRDEAVCAFTADAALPAAGDLAETWHRALLRLAPDARALDREDGTCTPTAAPAR